MLIFPKFQGCSSIIVPATPFWILKFKWAWQTQFLSHNPVTLKNCVFFVDLQMILISFFDVSNPNNQRKTDFVSTEYPQIGKIFTYLGMRLNEKISFLEITDLWFETSKIGTNIIWRSLKNTQFFKVTRLWLKNWVCGAHLNFKIQKGVAGTIIELQPWNFGKMSIFYSSSNDFSTNFWCF